MNLGKRLELERSLSGSSLEEEPNKLQVGTGYLAIPVYRESTCIP